MRTLDRYVLREWTKVCLLAALGFPFLVMVIDLADKFETYFGRGLSKARVAYSYVFFLPETISLVLPVAVLFAVVFTVGALGRHSELTAAKASGISFHRVMRPLLVASLAVVLLDLGLTELAPGASARRAELLGEKTARPSISRFSPFVYRADSGWVYSIRSLELRASGAEMRDPIMERGGTGEDYPTILVAAQRSTYDTARTARRWTLAKGAVRYLVGPGRETTFQFDSLRITTLRETTWTRWPAPARTRGSCASSRRSSCRCRSPASSSPYSGHRSRSPRREAVWHGGWPYVSPPPSWIS